SNRSRFCARSFAAIAMPESDGSDATTEDLALLEQRKRFRVGVAHVAQRRAIRSRRTRDDRESRGGSRSDARGAQRAAATASGCRRSAAARDQDSESVLERRI